MDEAMDKTPAELTMKPMLAVLVQQAVQLALVDVAMWSGEVRGRDLNVAPDSLTEELDRLLFRHQIRGGLDPLWAETLPDSALAKVAEEEGIELASLAECCKRPGWVERVERRDDQYTYVQIDGDDRWLFHVPNDAVLHCERYPTPAEREAWTNDVYLIPSNDFDPMALAQNVANRLFGSGGWDLPTPNGDAYTGNMTAREVFEASMIRPDRDHAAEVGAELSSRGWETGPIDPNRPLDEQGPDA